MDPISMISGFVLGGVGYIVPFIFVLSIVVFVHEFGHFQVGRWCGTRVEAFSIGFGKSIASWTDRKGTLWKVGWLPLGGYVKFWGDEDAISMSRPERLEKIAEDPSFRDCFHFKPLWQRALIVAAGPFMNFIFGALVFAVLFGIYGMVHVQPLIGHIQPGSAAEEAGLKPGDLVTTVDARRIDDFSDLANAVMASGGDPLTIGVERGGQAVSVIAHPKWTERPDGLGNKAKTYMLGAESSFWTKVTHSDVGPVGAVEQGAGRVYFIIEKTLAFVGGVFTGREDASQISGPAGTAQRAGQAAKLGFPMLIQLMAVLSVSIGLVNLFPVPMLDGGHLLFYSYEAVFRRPLGGRAQEYGLRIGLALVVSLMLFATWNDLMRIFWS